LNAVKDIAAAAHATAWKPSVRIAFRFAVVYFTLYTLVSQLIGGLILTPFFSFPALGTAWPIRDVTSWFAARLFRVDPPLLMWTGDSGDTAFYWTQTLLLLVISAAVCWYWTDADRERAEYDWLHKWFRLFIRFALAAQMFHYGIAKVIPTQFAAPSLVTLVEPVGNLSVTDLLWTFIGSSTPYQMFTGWAEMAAGLLLLVPRTTALGAIVAFIDMTQVFALNMWYDFGLKQISFNYMLMSLVVLAPDLPRLADVLLWNRPAPAAVEPALFASPRANRRAVLVQAVFSAYLLAMYVYIGVNYWYGPGGGGHPKSPLYGIWDVEALSIDGEARPTEDIGYDRRWRRVIFDAPDRMAFERTDDSFLHYDASVDAGAHTVTLTKKNSATWRASLQFAQPSDDEMTLEGDVDGQHVRVRTRRVDLATFRLLNSRFRWMRPPDPYSG
jgi:uncharacterized membrane protein YphA (DoxX/SURF4 family)